MRGSYQNLTLVSSRFSRRTERSGGTCACRKWNHCHTAVASGTRNHAKKGSVFATHLLVKSNTRPPQGGRLTAPKNGTRAGATVGFFKTLDEPSPASSPTGGHPWQANGRGTGSSVFESVASISSPQRYGPDATRLRISGGRCFYLWPRRTAFPR